MIQQLRVLLGFSSASDHQIEEIAGAVIEGMTDNPAFATPPVTMAALLAALTAFTQAIAAAVQGGTAATALKNDKRATVVDLLRQLAGYVQQNCNNDLATLLSSGFEAVSTNRAQQPLEQPVIARLDNANSGQLAAKVKAVRNAKCYEVRYAALNGQGTPGPWQTGGLFTDSRAMVFNTLTPGTTYNVQVRAIGGSDGYSDWSDPVSHMSM